MVFLPFISPSGTRNSHRVSLSSLRKLLNDEEKREANLGVSCFQPIVDPQSGNYSINPFIFLTTRETQKKKNVIKGIIQCITIAINMRMIGFEFDSQH